jgi:hypothetical protein
VPLGGSDRGSVAGPARLLGGSASLNVSSLAVGFVNSDSAVDAVVCTSAGAVWLLSSICSPGAVLTALGSGGLSTCGGLALGDVDADGDMVCLHVVDHPACALSRKGARSI